MPSPPLSQLLERFRNASCQTFAAHFLPYAQTERDYEVFAVVERALFQVMVLDHLSLRGGEPLSIPEITFRPWRTGTKGAIQGSPAEIRAFDETARIAFIQFLNTGPTYGEKRLDLVLGELRDGSGDQVTFNWSEVVVEDAAQLSEGQKGA